LPVDGDHIIYYRTLAHYERLRSLTEQTKQRFAVIGAGFIGSEIAAALTMNDQEVVLIFPLAGIGGHMFPPDLANFLNDYYREHGVEVVPDERIADVEQDEDGLILKTQSGREIRADHAVAGLGIDPNIELAQRAGLEVGDGIIVDSFLRTSDPNVYAAGDVASFYNATLDTRLRVEHEDNANTMGRLAGRAMAGEPEPYNYLPYFYSDLFELGYEAVGELKSDLELVTDWQEACRQGVVYYLQRGRVRGVLLWNVWDQLDAARELIAAPGPFKPNDLKGRLPA
jgi:NADPH-dependent 2,4-dienoyl-CoA reductase/sulfur reductase-like enzyme